MAITWKNPVDYNGVTKPTYEGAVIRLFHKVERVIRHHLLRCGLGGSGCGGHQRRLWR